MHLGSSRHSFSLDHIHKSQLFLLHQISSFLLVNVQVQSGTLGLVGDDFGSIGGVVNNPIPIDCPHFRRLLQNWVLTIDLHFLDMDFEIICDCERNRMVSPSRKQAVYVCQVLLFGHSHHVVCGRLRLAEFGPKRTWVAKEKRKGNIVLYF